MASLMCCKATTPGARPSLPLPGTRSPRSTASASATEACRERSVVGTSRLPSSYRAIRHGGAPEERRRPMRVATEEMHISRAHLGEPFEQLGLLRVSGLLPGRLPRLVSREPPPARAWPLPSSWFSSRLSASKSSRWRTLSAPHGSGLPKRSRGRSGLLRDSVGVPVLPVAFGSCGPRLPGTRRHATRGASSRSILPERSEPTDQAAARVRSLTRLGFRLRLGPIVLLELRPRDRVALGDAVAQIDLHDDDLDDRRDRQGEDGSGESAEGAQDQRGEDHRGRRQVHGVLHDPSAGSRSSRPAGTR